MNTESHLKQGTHVRQKERQAPLVALWIRRSIWKWRARRCTRLMVRVMMLRNESQRVAYFDLDQAAQRLCVAASAFRDVARLIK